MIVFSMPDRQWDDFPRSPPRHGAEVQLIPNGWLAEIAFIAGPEWVYQVRHEAPDVVITGPSGRQSSAPATHSDRMAIHEDMTDFLSEAGIPEPPFAVEWRLRLPERLTGDALMRACNRAGFEAGAYHGPEAAKRLQDLLRTILV
ncbi:MAG: DUF5956 family protein [Pseudoclavibacter sp.]